MPKRTYTYDEIKTGELTGFFGFAAALLFMLLVTWVAGCGEVGTFGRPSDNKPGVEILCDVTSCTVLVHDATTITTWYDGELHWYVDREYAPRRYTVRDIAPEVSITVEACNEHGCTERTLVVLELAQNDENDPLGCDPTLPCPIEALS